VPNFWKALRCAMHHSNKQRLRRQEQISSLVTP
jgi:hypothetical protein